ncbi:MAG: immunoglobulin domain-containing protein [Verrucomicrobiae bacterium]|nr:immunoglobulin domain-containing protein [Verrucomicrobiae bacterium]
MKPSHPLLLSIALAAAPWASAQEITPVWVQHTALPEAQIKHPILRAQFGDETPNGTSVMDFWSGFERYDATRVVIGVKENGINESDPGLSAAQRTLAERYPDRSLIYLDAATGDYIGIAHVMPLRPVPMEQEWIDREGSLDGFEWKWAFDDGAPGQKAIYSTYKNKILRWAPLPEGGWSSTPTIAFEEPTPGTQAAIEAEAAGITTEYSEADGPWWQWRFAHLRVSGSGADTRIIAGGITWRRGMHNQYLATTDGLKFKPVARVNDRDGGLKTTYGGGGQGTSALRHGTDPTRPNLLTQYKWGYPSDQGGGVRRFTFDPDDVGNVKESNPGKGYDPDMQVGFFNQNHGSHGMPGWEWDQVGGWPGEVRDTYDGLWPANMEGADEVDYIVSYSMPSWNNTLGGNYRPGWLAVHRLNGDTASGNSSFQIPVTEEDEGNPAVGPFFGVTRGDVQVYPDPEVPNKSTVLWAGESIGFGVFTVQNTPATLVSSPASQTVAAGSTVTLTAEVTGSPNDFQWYRNGIPVPKTPYTPGARKVSLTITEVTQADAGTYVLRWNNPVSGPGATAPAVLTVTGAHVRWAGSTDIFLEAAMLPFEGELTTGANSFTLTTGGYGAFNTAGFENPDNRGDFGYFRYETVVGDFDKKVRVVSLTSQDELEGPASLARASLMVRESPNGAMARTLEIFAANPDGANLVRVAGRSRTGQNYSPTMSRNYPGVAENLPNQWLRIRRVGNAFSFFVGTDGNTWSLISEQYEAMSATLYVGAYAATDEINGVSTVRAEFANYGDHIATDTTPPALVSVGTLDKLTVGVKFSEAVNPLTATDHRNYSISQGTIYNARMGLSDQTVYLDVAGLTADTFTVTVQGVVDLAGNAVPAGSSASGRRSNWISTDIGYIQDLAARPTPGDDPYVVGRAVAISSTTNPEVEIIGGGSNAYNIGDYMHYLYREYTGDFDVVVAVNRFNRRGIAGGYGNGGLHIRAGLYRTDNDEIGENTKVPSYVNITYYEGSDPNRAAIELNRPAPGDGYGNNNPNDNNTEIDGLLGFFTGLGAINAAGELSPQYSPTQAKWLRVQRVGQAFTSYLSYNGTTWLEQDAPNRIMENLPATVLVGFGHQNDTGYGVPPEDNTYGGNGTPHQNESNYGVLRISRLGDFVTIDDEGPGQPVMLEIARAAGGALTISWTGSGVTLESATAVTGPFSPAGLPVTTIGDRHTVTVTPSAAAAYYRARR